MHRHTTEAASAAHTARGRQDHAAHRRETMRYTLFGQHTGLRVSTLVLGTGMFGTKWGHGADPTESRRMFDGSLEAGGNFLDTADTYQFGESESLLGAFVHATREDLILASKYSLSASPHGNLVETGNNRKAMVRSLEASLKRLHTDRLDLYWVHMPDGMTPIDDIMRGFDDLVRAGTILYAGLSDFPAWRVARAATLAEWRGWVPLAGVQLAYSLVERTPERELLPMAAAFGLGTVAWSPLGGGVLTGKYRKGEMGRQRGWAVVSSIPRTPRSRRPSSIRWKGLPRRRAAPRANSPSPGSQPRARCLSSGRARGPSLRTISVLSMCS